MNRGIVLLGGLVALSMGLGVEGARADVGSRTDAVCCGANCCLILGCRANGDPNPSDPCEFCDPAESQFEWTRRDTPECSGEPFDAGPGEDAGPMEEDAGPMEEDAGPMEEDAGPTEEDAGSTEEDAGSSGTDAGTTGGGGGGCAAAGNGASAGAVLLLGLLALRRRELRA